MLGGLIGQLTHGRAVIWTGDSFGFLEAGLRLAAGQDPATHLEGRNIGYTLLSAWLLPLGGLRALVTAQSVAAAASLVAILLLLREVLRNRWVFCIAGLAMVLMAYASDSFVVYAQTLNADSLFGSFLSISLVLFCLAWRRDGAARLGCMIGSLALGYAAFLMKPNAMFVLPLGAAALAWMAWRARRAILEPRVLAALAALVVAVVLGQTWQARWKNPDVYFGPGMLYAAHMNVTDRDLDLSKPAERDLHQALQAAMHGPKWAVLGFDSDLCYYDDRCQAAIRAAAKADGADAGSWMMRRLIAAIIHHPATYTLKVVRQTAFFFGHPNLEVDLVYPGAISDWDWTRIAPYDRLVRFHRAELNRQVGSWMVARHPVLSFVGKHLVGAMRRSLPFSVVIAAAAVAAGVRRRRFDGLEVTILSATLYLLACVLSVAISFTFDIPRYAASFAVLTYLWWGFCWLWLVRWARRLVRVHPDAAGVDIDIRWGASRGAPRV